MDNFKPKLFEAAQHTEPGKMYIAEIQHDSWCRFFKTNGKKECNCSPNVVTREVGS